MNSVLHRIIMWKFDWISFPKEYENVIPIGVDGIIYETNIYM